MVADLDRRQLVGVERRCRAERVIPAGLCAGTELIFAEQLGMLGVTAPRGKVTSSTRLVRS